jgi:alpha-glucosidase
MVGPDLLVAAPPFLDKADDYDAEMPSAGWYDFWTGKRVEEVHPRAVEGGVAPTGAVLSTVHLHPDLANLPVFVRPGAILPTEPLVQSTAELPQGPLLLRVFPGPDCAGEIYQDDGTTFAYRRGEYLRMRFTCTLSPDKNELTIRVGKHEGTYPAWWSQVSVEVADLPKAPASVTVNGDKASLIPSETGFMLTLPDPGTGMEIILLQ